MQNLKSILLIIAVISIFSSCNKEEVNLYYPTDGLVSYFPFEGNLQDAHGDTPEGTKSEFGVIYANGSVGQGLKLDGNDGKVEFDRTLFSTGNSTSVSFWFNTNEEAIESTMIGNSDFVIYNFDQFVEFNLRGVSDTYLFIGNYVYNTWVHFVVSYDGDSLRFYLNNTLVFESSPSITLGRTDRLLEISPNSNWSGSMDELFIYDKALSQEEVTQLFNR